MLHPNDYDHLRGQLRGISDRALGAHLELYRRAVTKLAAIDAAYPMIEWVAPGASLDTDAPLTALLATPVAKLELTLVGPMADCIQQVHDELSTKGIGFRPAWYFGTSADDFWTADRGISVNIPWCFANLPLWRLANKVSATAYSQEEMLRTLRHEAGHALCYGFELWKRPDWRALFGDSLLPYNDEFAPRLGSREFVEYLKGVKAHYAQKHPDEDFAEAFACWLDPAQNWEEQYADWPVALRKLRYVEKLATDGVLSGPAPNQYIGQREPYTRVRGTVAQALGLGKRPTRGGVPGPWSEHAAIARSEAAVYNDVVLHEAHFGALVGGGSAVAPSPFLGAVLANWGSWESYLLDLRLISAATDGWALTVWDERRGQVQNVMVEQTAPAGCKVLLALDCHEHAYALDYGLAKYLGIAAQMANIDWLIVVERMPDITIAKMQAGQGSIEMGDSKP